ncbi:MAG: HAD family phosphatase [Dehalococcoidia bacterium]
MTIKAVFFDFGGVLLQHMDGVDHKALEARFGLEDRTLMRCLYRDSRYMEFQVGGCTHEEWQGSIREAAVALLGAEKATEVLAAYEKAERPLNPDMMSLVTRLRATGYLTGIISNTIPGLEERISDRDAQYPPEDRLATLFDVRVGSGDIGIAKPDPAIFQHALEKAGMDAEASVFTDDVAAYAEAASSLGMRGFHFTGYEKFASDLRSVGVNH